MAVNSYYPYHESPWIESTSDTLKFLEDLFSKYEKKYKKEQYLYHQGEKSDYIYIVKSGRVRYAKTSTDGNEHHIIIGKPGCFFGDISCFDDLAEGGSLSCIVDSSLYVVPKSIIINNFFENRKFADLMMLSICRKYRSLEAMLGDFVMSDAYTRVSKQLLNLANAHGEKVNDKIKITINFTHDDLSKITNLSRVSVSMIMSELSKQGIIHKKDGYTYILDYEKLKLF